MVLCKRPLAKCIQKSLHDPSQFCILSLYILNFLTHAKHSLWLLCIFIVKCNRCSFFADLSVAASCPDLIKGFWVGQSVQDANRSKGQVSTLLVKKITGPWPFIRPIGRIPCSLPHVIKKASGGIQPAQSTYSLKGQATGNSWCQPLIGALQ